MQVDFNMLCSICYGNRQKVRISVYTVTFLRSDSTCLVVFSGGASGLWVHLEILAINSILRGRVASIQVLGEFTIFSQRATSSEVESIQSTSVPQLFPGKKGKLCIQKGIAHWEKTESFPNYNHQWKQLGRVLTSPGGQRKNCLTI